MPDSSHSAEDFELAPKYTNVKAVAKRLDVSVITVYGLLDKGAIESVYIGTLRKVLLSSLYEYEAGLSSVHPDAR